MGIPRPRSLVRPVLVAAVAALTLLGVIAPASAGTSPYCGITWGSMAKGISPVGSGAGVPLTDVRAGEHDCYDRLVLDLRHSGSFNAWHVQYVNQVREDPSDRPVPLRGGAFLLITLGTTDHTPDGVPTYQPANRRELVNVAGFQTFRQVAEAGSFEGVTSAGLGVRARLPFHVFTLSGPAPGQTRLVVDVAHRW